MRCMAKGKALAVGVMDRYLTRLPIPMKLPRTNSALDEAVLGESAKFL